MATYTPRFRRMIARMSHAQPSTPSLATWTSLVAYWSGYAFFGFLLAMSATHPNQGVAIWATLIGMAILSWSGAIASDSSKERAFPIAIVGGLILVGAVAWSATMTGEDAFAAAVLGALMWGYAWAASESTAISGAVVIALGFAALITWAMNGAAFLGGIIFMFVASSIPAIGERLGDRRGGLPTFLTLMVTAGFGLFIGWLAQGWLAPNAL